MPTEAARQGGVPGLIHQLQGGRDCPNGQRQQQATRSSSTPGKGRHHRTMASIMALIGVVAVTTKARIVSETRSSMDSIARCGPKNHH